MATSSAYGFTAGLADILDDATERIGKDPAVFLTGRHVTSALRSIDMAFSHWGNEGGSLPWAVDWVNYTAVDGADNFVTATGTIDILGAVLRRSGADTPILRISRQEYLDIPDKTVEGRPDRYFVDRTQTVPTAYIWPLFENATDIIRYSRLRHLQNTGAFANDPHIPQSWIEALTSELAARMAEKWAVEREDKLRAKADRWFKEALNGSADLTDVVIRPSFGGGRRW